MRIRKLRHALDGAWEKALLRGFLAPLAFLTLGALVVVFIGTIALSIFNVDVKSSGEGFWNLAWEVLLRAMSPDQLTNQESWSGRLSLLAVTLVGLLIVTALISISNVAVSQRLEGLRKGKKPIRMTGHLVLVNWNDFGFRVLREIAEANATLSSARDVVILCDEDPLELRTAIRSNFQHHRDPSHPASWWLKHPDSWISIRRGLGHHTNDLLQLSAIGEASGAIVFQTDDVDESQAVRSVLAINAVLRSNSAQKHRDSSPLPVVTFNADTELIHKLDRRLEEIAKSPRRDDVRQINYIPLSPDAVRSGIETQVARHRGLSAVYQDLLDFGGEELYVVDPPRNISSFGDFFLRATESIPIGIVDHGVIDLWPNWTENIENKSVIVLATDRPGATRVKFETAFEVSLNFERQEGRHPQNNPENFLFIGWNNSAEELRCSLPTLLPSGSTLTVLLRESEFPPTDTTFGAMPIEIVRRSKEDPLDQPGFLSLFQHVVVLASMDIPAQRSDAQVLTDLLMCRHHADGISNPDQRFTIVGELRRRSSRYVAGVRLADDLLISDSLMAAAATQMVMQPELESVLSALLSVSDPVEIITLPLREICFGLSSRRWSELQFKIAEQTGEIALGYREDVDGVGKVTLNPRKEALVPLESEIVLLSRAIISK